MPSDVGSDSRWIRSCGHALGDVLRRAPGLAVHEHQVDVGGVVQLERAPLAEGDHCEGVARDDAARRLHARVGHVADLAHDLFERRAGQVARRDP